jgi:hypothetical protein
MGTTTNQYLLRAKQKRYFKIWWVHIKKSRDFEDNVCILGCGALDFGNNLPAF